MKKLIFTLVAIFTTCVNANALSVERSREEARFLTDKMAYELNLTDEQLQDIYEINYDYFRSLGPVDGIYDDSYNLRYRNINYVLADWQWEEFLLREYFLRPAYIFHGGWAFGIYNYYARTRFYFGIPSCYYHYHGYHHHHRHHDYYRDRRPMHHHAMANRPRPHNTHRPEMTRPNANHHGNGNMNRHDGYNRHGNNGNMNRHEGNHGNNGSMNRHDNYNNRGNNSNMNRHEGSHNNNSNMNRHDNNRGNNGSMNRHENVRSDRSSHSSGSSNYSRSSRSNSSSFSGGSRGSRSSSSFSSGSHGVSRSGSFGGGSRGGSHGGGSHGGGRGGRR